MLLLLQEGSQGGEQQRSCAVALGRGEHAAQGLNQGLTGATAQQLNPKTWLLQQRGLQQSSQSAAIERVEQAEPHAQVAIGATGIAAPGLQFPQIHWHRESVNLKLDLLRRPHRSPSQQTGEQSSNAAKAV